MIPPNLIKIYFLVVALKIMFGVILN